MNTYNLSRFFWDFAFENPSKIKPIHCAIYFFSIEHCNRLGWKKEFGLPTSLVIEAIGVKSYSVYKKAFDDLVKYNFFDVIQYSKNQYSSNIIALKENYKANAKAPTKALDKAMQKQLQKQSNSTVTIDKQETIKQITYNKVVDEILISLKDLFNDDYLVSDKTKVMFDKLLKKYSKDEILKATFWARTDDFWKSNFCSPMKLEKKNKDGVTYIDVFLEKAGNYQPPTQKKQEPQQPIYSGYIDLSKLKPLR